MLPTDRILANDVYRSRHSHITGLNNNDLIIGASGAGKTRSYVLPNLLQQDGSMIVIDTKGNLYKQFHPYLCQHGYRVLHLNFKDLSDPDQCGYNPLHYISFDPATNSYREQSILEVAAAIVPITTPKDPFWEKSARLYLATLISYVLEETPKESHTLLEVMELVNLMETADFDALFAELISKKPTCLAARQYQSLKTGQTAKNTYACIKMFLYEKLQLLAIAPMKHLYLNQNMLHIDTLGKEKTVLFVSVSDCDRSLDCLVGLLYQHCFQTLIRTADQTPTGRLPVPVRILMDDFATNCLLEGFDNLISVIRSREIYVSVIIQSISQLVGLYGSAKADTIINNCDTVLYLGGQDLTTAQFLSHRLNKPISTILNLPLSHAYLLTRGQAYLDVQKFEPTAHPNYRQWLSALSDPTPSEHHKGGTTYDHPSTHIV